MKAAKAMCDLVQKNREVNLKRFNSIESLTTSLEGKQFVNYMFYKWK